MQNDNDIGPIYLEPRECFDNAVIKIEDTHVIYSFDLIIEVLILFYELDVDKALDYYDNEILPIYESLQKLYILNSPLIIFESELED